MKTVAVASNQVRYFTLEYYVREFVAGSAIVYGGLSEVAQVYIGKGKMKLRDELARFNVRRSSRDVEQQTSKAKRDEADLQHVENLSAVSTSTSLVQLVDKKSNGLSSMQLGDRLQLAGSEDDHPTTLHFGFVLLSKMLNTSIQFIPAFALNLRFGLSPSRRFVSLSYLLLIVSLIAGIHLSSFILEPSIRMFVGRMNSSLKRICTVSAAIGQVGYITYSMVTCAYILYQRRFLQNFIYHSCSIITLARSYQRRQIVSLFIAFNLFAFLSEPLFGLLALSHDVHQPNYWPQLETRTFKLAKWTTILCCGLGSAVISSGTVIIPMMTCFLITASMKHLKNLVQKQSSRCHQTAIWNSTSHNESLLTLLSPETRAIMEEFACETLTMDWPTMIEISAVEKYNQISQIDSIPNGCMSLMGEEDHRVSSLFTSAHNRLAQELSSKSSYDNGLDLNSMLDTASSKINSSKASSLLFLYKNLIKSLSELKCVILDYERKFGNFHQILSLLSCLIVSLWVTSAFAEVRRGRSNAAGPINLIDAGDQLILNQTSTNSTTTTQDTLSQMTQEEEYKQRRTAYTIRIVCCTLSFILSNVYIFLKCDCLSDRIIKIRSQLFKMNIDLALTFISAQKNYNREPLRELATKQQMGPIRPAIRVQCATPETGTSVVSGLPSNNYPFSTEPSERLKNFSGSVYEVNHWRHYVSRAQFEHHVNQCSELDQVWSLYDQVTRISSKVNFRFTSDSYYSKKCVLLVFGRSISLVLFFIQIIDMYTS